MSTPDTLLQKARTEMPGFKGALTGPEDPGYEEARKVYNAMIDRRPALDRPLCRCRGRREGRLLRPRPRDPARGPRRRPQRRRPGHLRRRRRHRPLGLKEIEVDPGARTVRVGGGCTWGDVDAATHEHGLATPSGIISTTGVGGLTLGGGIGHLTRKCGLTIDNLLEAEVVLASGERVRAARGRERRPLLGDPRRRRQLRRRHLVPLPPASGGHDRRRPDVLADRAGRRGAEGLPRLPAHAPRELNGFFAFPSVPPAPPFPEELHLRKVCGIVWCYSGDPKDAGDAMAPLLEALPEPLIARRSSAMPLPGAAERLRPGSTRPATSGTGAPTSSTRSPTRRSRPTPSRRRDADLEVDHAPLPDRRRRPRRRPADTAWAYRDANWGAVIVGVDPDPANADEIRDWSVDYWEALHPYSAGGAYVNFMMDEGQERVRATYGANYDRLARDQGDIRPGQPLPRQPEHRAEWLIAITTLWS